MKRTLLAACLGLVAVAPVARAQNLIQNGSFENGTFLNSANNTGPIRDSWVEIQPGSSYLSSWTIDFGLFNWHTTKVGELASAQDGSRFADLVHNNGLATGISQTVATTAGQLYRLSFWMSGPGSFTPNPRLVLVDVTGMPQQSFTTPLSTNADNISWEFKSYNFTATSSSTRIAFQAPSTSTGYWGPVLDNVALTAVPEPSTYALVGAGLLGMGVVARRRRRN